MISVFDQVPDWDTVARQAFWDRKVEQGDWKAGMLAGHGSYLPQTLRMIDPRQAIALLGRNDFVQAWPFVRETAIARWPELARRIRKWDVYWSVAATGRLDIRPLPAWHTLARRTREFLLYIADHQGSNIYAAAKAMGMTYRRAHDHASKLIELGFFARKEQTTGSRKRVLLYATHDAPMRGEGDGRMSR